MVPGDFVIYTSRVYRWLLVGEETPEKLLDLKLSEIRIQENEVYPVIQVRMVNNFKGTMVQLLTPSGIGWISTEWLKVV